MIPPTDSSIAPIIAPMKTQRELPDIIPAPFRTNGESEASTAGARSCASIEVINRSGGIWFGISCIPAAVASGGPPILQQGSYEPDLFRPPHVRPCPAPGSIKKTRRALGFARAKLICDAQNL